MKMLNPYTLKLPILLDYGEGIFAVSEIFSISPIGANAHYVGACLNSKLLNLYIGDAKEMK